MIKESNTKNQLKKYHIDNNELIKYKFNIYKLTKSIYKHKEVKTCKLMVPKYYIAVNRVTKTIMINDESNKLYYTNLYSIKRFMKNTEEQIELKKDNDVNNIGTASGNAEKTNGK